MSSSMKMSFKIEETVKVETLLKFVEVIRSKNSGDNNVRIDLGGNN